MTKLPLKKQLAMVSAICQLQMSLYSCPSLKLIINIYVSLCLWMNAQKYFSLCHYTCACSSNAVCYLACDLPIPYYWVIAVSQGIQYFSEHRWTRAKKTSITLYHNYFILVFVNWTCNLRSKKAFFRIHFNYTSSENALCPCLTFFSIAEHASRMWGKRANTIEHQANYVAVNYSSVTQVCKLADTYSFLFTQCVLKACSQGPQKKL